MADAWYASISAGLGDASSYANRAAYSNAAVIASEAGFSTGDTLYLSNETHIATSDWVETLAGSTGAPISIKGYNVSDGNVDGSIAIVDFNSGAFGYKASKASRYHCNVRITNTAGAGVTMTARTLYSFYENFSVSGAGSYGMNLANNLDGGIIRNSTIINCANSGITAGPNTQTYFSQAIGCTGKGFEDQHTVMFSIAHDCNSYGISIKGVEGVIMGNVIDGNGNSGVFVSSGQGTIISLNRITNNAGWGIDGNSLFLESFTNAFYNNTSGEIENGAGSMPVNGSITLTGDGYTDRANDDFTILSTDEGMASVPFGDENETTNVGKMTCGIPPEYSGGGGSSVRRKKIQSHGV